MPGNKARFTKIRYEVPEDNEIIERLHISSEQHTINHILRNLNNIVEFITILHGVLQLNADLDVMDSELSRALQEHLKLEQRLEMLEDHRLVSHGKNETSQLEKNIKTSFRNLLRLLKAHPLLLSAWKKGLDMETGKYEWAIIKELNVLGGLETKPQLAAAKPVSDLKDRQDFTATMEEITTKISWKSQEITILHSCLQKKREEESTLQEQLQSTTEESAKMQKKIQQEVNQMRIQLNDLMYSNFEEETVLRQKIKKVVAVTERFVHFDFDEEMEALQASLELNTINYEQEVEEVKKLEMLYSELNVEYRYILEKHQLSEEKKEEEAKELTLKTEAALLIQTWWRGFCVRKTLKQREKKGIKGKKEKLLERGKIGQKDTERKANRKKTM